MRSVKFAVLTALCGASLASASVAGAQTVVVPTPGTSPSVPTQGHQVVGGVAGVSTAASPGMTNDGGLPSIDNASKGNVAGLLSYCVHKRILNDTTTRVTGRTLAKAKDVKSDPGYSLGGQGLLQNDTPTPFKISTLDKSKQVELCSQIVKKGQSMTD
ncbi:DUF2501 domain-containing protein [Acetobacter sp. AN02]|nr:DUF2501 domain-containing protein [Acetobacter sp. AN02]MDG6095443.1 DUF2501 domain-containing protein [Acetobacter sp. AN02]